MYPIYVYIYMYTPYICIYIYICICICMYPSYGLLEPARLASPLGLA